MVQVIAIYINDSQYIDIHVSTGFFAHYGIDYVGYYSSVDRIDKGHFGTIYVPLMHIDKMASVVRHESVHVCFDWFISHGELTHENEQDFAIMQDKIVDGFVERMK